MIFNILETSKYKKLNPKRKIIFNKKHKTKNIYEMDKINLEIERVKKEYEKINSKRKIRVYKRHKIKNSIKDIFKIDKIPNLEVERSKKKYEIYVINNKT